MSKPQVTITLGRSGQVVRRGGAGSDDGRTDTRQLSGGKRSIRDRLGSNAASSSLSSSKRQRGDGSGWSPGNNGVDGARVGRNDLRLKLMRKKISKRMQGGGENRKKDLREKLTRTIRSPVNVDMQRRNEPRESRVSRQLPSVRSVDNLVQLESSRRSYSSVTMDAFRSRSPDRVMKSYRGVSPPRNIDELRRMPTRRTLDASRNSPPRNLDDLRQVPTRRTIDASRNMLMSSHGVFEPSRPIGPSSVTMQGALEMSKPVSRMPPPPPPAANVIMHRSSYMGDNIADLLHSLGLGKYYINFQAEEVDMTALRQMGDNDLKEMGIPMGPRKKILLAIMPRTKRQPP